MRRKRLISCNSVFDVSLCVLICVTMSLVSSFITRYEDADVNLISERACMRTHTCGVLHVSYVSKRIVCANAACCQFVFVV